MRIVVDALGGDHAPSAVLDGVSLALAKDPDLQVVLTGPAEVVEPFAAAGLDRIEAVVTTEAIAMDEHPAEAVRSKKDSSIVVGCKLVADGMADGFFSAGSTGAVMTAATLVIGRIKGIARPMIASMLPTVNGKYVVFGDVGANADVKPEYLLQFAQMGQAYVRAVSGLADPSVGLLNIGEESTKGNELAQRAYQLLADGLEGFIGNAEGTDILSGRFDVIVTDGFTGNVVLKTIEGVVGALFSELTQILSVAFVDKDIAALITPGLNNLKKRFSADEIGAAPLLGVSGSCFIGHGSSSPKAIANGISATHQAANAGLAAVIAETVA